MKSIFTIFLIILVSGILAQEPVKVKCAATTKKGQPCKCYAMKDSDYCNHHQDQDKNNTLKATFYTCGAPTAKGTPCKNHVKNQGDKCHYHNR